MCLNPFCYRKKSLSFISLQVGDITEYVKSAEEAFDKYDAEKDTNLVRPEPDSQDLPPEWFLKVSNRALMYHSGPSGLAVVTLLDDL